jgi:hypothetical protein
VWGTGFKGTGYRVQGYRVQGYRVQGSRVQDTGYREKSGNLELVGKERGAWEKGPTG